MNFLPVSLNTDLIDSKEMQALQQIAPELNHAYKVRQIFRTDTEAEVSVLDDIHHPTPGDKWWQSVREQMVMLDNLVMLSFEHRKNELRLKRIEKRLASWFCWDREGLEIERDICLFSATSMRSTASDRVREILMWSRIKRQLDDGSFDTNNVDTHQLVSLTTQYCLRSADLEKMKLGDGEYNNLVGQLLAGLRVCKEKGVLEQVFSNLSPKLAKQMKELAT